MSEITVQAESNNLIIDSNILLQGQYERLDHDLKIKSASNEVLLKDYFLYTPTLSNSDGSTLSAKIVSLLAINNSPTVLGFEDPKAIGKITITDGPVNVIRANQNIQLNEGDFIYLNDVVGDKSTGAVGISFADQSSISIDPGAQMVIDDFVYDPENPTTGSMNANVISGNFSFVSGQIAKTGNDAMQVTTPVLTIGVRGTQVAGKANTDGQENEIVLLPNEDGTVGQVMIKNDSGEVLLTEAYQATVIFDPYTVPTVPVILAKTEVLKKFATTIATTKKTEKIAKVERETEEAVKQKEEAEEEKEELEEEKEKLEEEAEELEEEKEELEEKVEELEEEKEEVAEEKEEIEEKLDEAFEEKEQIEEKQEEVAEEIEELEEKLEDANIQERQAIEQELEKLEEEFEEIEEEVQEIEEEIEVVVKEKVKVEKKVREIEKEFEQAQDDFSEIEQNIQVIEKEVLQVIEKELVIEQEIKFVEEKFDAIVEEFEVFQKEFVQEFEDFIPEEEIQQFMEEAPIELIEEFQENIIEKLEEEKINVQENENEVERDEDPFAEENVEKKLDELDEKQEELIEKADELMEKDMQLQEEAKQLEEEAKELEEEALQLEKEAEEAYRNNDQEAIEEIEQKFEELDEEFQQIDDGFQELDEQYEEINQDFEELNNEFIAIDEEFQEVFPGENMVVRIPEDGPGFNEDNDVFMVPEDEQIEVNVEEFIQEEKQKVIENNQFAEEAEDFFQNEEIQEMDIDENVQDMFIINSGQMDQFIEGAGSGINNADDYHAQEDEMDDIFYVVDNNEELYNYALEADDWFDQFIADLAEDQNINVAPWLDMPNDTSVSENLSVGTTLGYVYGSDANGDQLTYSILSDESGKIAIDGSRLYLNSAFDNISSNTDYSVLLKVQDPYGASDVDEWVVTVTAIAGPSLSSTSTVSMAENASDGATVADIDHTGGDGTVTYSITAGNGEGKFSINSSTGVITYNTQAAVLTTETFESTSDGATPTGWTGATVDDTTYYGNILGRFNGDSNTGQDVYKTFDFNSSHAGKRVAIDFNFWEFGTWDATNHGSLDQRFMVYVNDTLVVQDLRRYTGNNQQKYGETVGNLGTGWTPSPKESGMAIVNNAEGELYRVYGTLDSNGDIKLGFGARLDESLANESGAVDNIKISLTDLNYEDATSHTLTITATDASNQTDTVSQLITVTDVNEAPYFIDNVYAARTIDENGSSGTDVAKVHAEDLEGDSITYSITAGNTNSKFTIGSSTGLIETAGALDYETTSSYTLTITATDEHSATDTTTITVNVGDVSETTQYSQGISNTSIDAWGARYSHDMVLNNAWTDGKILVMHGDRSVSGTSQSGGILDSLDTNSKTYTMTYDTDSAGNFSTMTLAYVSQFEQIWDFNYNTRVNSNSSLTDLWGKYIMAGGSLVAITEHQSWDTTRNADIEGFINVIDTTSSTNGGLISGSGPTPQNLQAEYRAWSDTNSVLSAKPGSATSTYHKESMGKGDLVFQESGDSNDGAVAEWSREDTEAEYTGAFLAWGDIDAHSNVSSYGNTNAVKEIGMWLAEQNEDAMTESDGAGIVVDSEYIPRVSVTGSPFNVNVNENFVTAVEAINIGNNVYIGGGMDHIDLVWDDSADAAYWAFNTDADDINNFSQADDHYGVIGYDRDGDGDLWETTDTFDLDKIKILDDSEDYLTQDSDASGDYYLSITPVTYTSYPDQWTIEFDNTVTVSNTTGYNGYLDLSSNSAFDDINYAIIETESALISEVVVTA